MNATATKNETERNEVLNQLKSMSENKNADLNVLTDAVMHLSSELGVSTDKIIKTIRNDINIRKSATKFENAMNTFMGVGEA